ncbi:hypothetical protein GLAREA_11646 [Glarea lozoyensis ATCC 20868]|uniref:Uncharacterized protein n=1 Tax=Glarea lozoyensis (strain ATCC 20868 / MF5171) TaxID=1116229 RepID=S3CGP1_GLAL2|nr:uncharacterized protein GLAREA_11646 [Glarea lozoyensis ATCC 20868]EPE25065.1 hypothetical protein GLAREA_11646 [Glarea lozoyensis ATCC 20868]
MVEEPPPEDETIKFPKPERISNVVAPRLSTNEVRSKRRKKVRGVNCSLNEGISELPGVTLAPSPPTMSNHLRDIHLKPFPTLSSKSSYESFTTARTSSSPDVVNSLSSKTKRAHILMTPGPAKHNANGGILPDISLSESYADNDLTPTATRNEVPPFSQGSSSSTSTNPLGGYSQIDESEFKESPSGPFSSLSESSPSFSSTRRSINMPYTPARSQYHLYHSPGVPTPTSPVVPLDTSLPNVVDPMSLQYAVHQDPQGVFQAMRNIISARDKAIEERDDAVSRMTSCIEERDFSFYRSRREEADHQKTKDALQSMRTQLRNARIELGDKKHEKRKDQDLIQRLYKELKELKAELTFARQNCDGSRSDHQNALEVFESLQHINDSKIAVMWKYVDRLQSYIAHLRGGGSPDSNFEKIMNWQILQSQQCHNNHASSAENIATHEVNNFTITRPEILDPQHFPELVVRRKKKSAISECDGLSDVSTIVPLDDAELCPNTHSQNPATPIYEEAQCRGVHTNPCSPTSQKAQKGLMKPPPVSTYAQAISKNAGNEDLGKGKRKPKTKSKEAAVQGTENKAPFNPSAQTFIPVGSPTKSTCSTNSNTIASSTPSDKAIDPVLPLAPPNTPTITHNPPEPDIIYALPHRPTGVLLLPPNPYLTTTLPPYLHTTALTNHALELPLPLIHLSLSTLPTPYQTLCPFALTSQSCPLTTCTLNKPCYPYNDETLPLDACSGDCGRIHIYKTCLMEIDGRPNECAAFKHCAGGKHRSHLSKRVHFGTCEGEEWKARRLLADLREVHRLGRWGGVAVGG